MSVTKVCVLGLAVSCALLPHCASRSAHVKSPWASLDARYVSWEPTTTAVPAVDDRKRAREYLETSLRLWKEAAYPSYVYTRARQLGNRELELTAFQVIDGRVAQRTLVRLDPEELTSSAFNVLVKRTSLWHETGHSVGAHEGGFPVATLDQLYERCRREVLATHPELRVRMHFDMRGFLQACGFATEDCDDCATVSVQTVAKEDRPSSRDLRRDLCVDYDGLTTTSSGTPNWGGGCLVCSCWSGRERPEPEPKAKPKPKPEPPPDPGAAEELCRIDPSACADHPYLGERLEDICEIDPSACPKQPPPDGPWGYWGFWMCKTLLSADCGGRAMPTVRAPICVGKATPTESRQEARARCEGMEMRAWSAAQRATR